MGGATYALADKGRRRAVPARSARGLATPWGPRVSVKGSTTAGFGIGAAAGPDVLAPASTPYVNVWGWLVATSDTYTLNVDADVSDAQRAVDKLVRGVDKEKVEIPVAADTADAERDISGLTVESRPTRRRRRGEPFVVDERGTDHVRHSRPRAQTQPLEDPVEIRATVEGIAQLEGDLERVAAKAKEINDTPIRPDTSGATSGLRDIEGSATNAKSVLANMVGNASQDLGALGGVAGSAGVAIGQMGEYIADAFSADKRAGAKQILTEFAGVVGPIAGITAGLGLAQAAMDVYKDEAAAAAETTDELSAAMGEAGSDAGNFADVLRGDAEELRELQHGVERNCSASGGFGPTRWRTRFRYSEVSSATPATTLSTWRNGPAFRFTTWAR